MSVQDTSRGVGRESGSGESGSRESGSRLTGLLSGYTRDVDFGTERVVTIADTHTALLVESGALDLFAVDLGRLLQGEANLAALVAGPDGGSASGRWTFLCRLEAGTLLLGTPHGPHHSLLGRPLADTKVVRIPRQTLQGLLGGSGRAAVAPAQANPVLLDGFVTSLEQGLTALADGLREGLPPRDFVALDGSEAIPVAEGAAARLVVPTGWVRVEGGSLHRGMDPEAGSLTTGDIVFLTGDDWLVAESDAVLRLHQTEDLLRDGSLWPTLGQHQVSLLRIVDTRVARAHEREATSLQRRVEMDEQALNGALRSFSSVLADEADQVSLAGEIESDPALAAMRLVGERLGVPIVAPTAPAGVGRSLSPTERIAVASGVRTRTLRLTGRWWRSDSGPLVGYRRGDDGPVALLPSRRGYLLYDPAADAPRRVDGRVASELTNIALTIYRPLPSHVRTGRQLLRFGLSGCRSDLVTVLWTGLVVALLGLVVPIATGTVLGTLVPEGERSLIVQACLLVLLAAVVASIFSAVQNLAVLRIEGRADVTMQAAVWDHLMALPTAFFGRHPTGELTTGALAVSTIRSAISGVSITATLAMLTGLFNFVLLFVYSVPLAFIAAALIAVALGLATVVGFYETRLQTELFRTQRLLSSRVFQLLTGLPKLRVAAAEDRAFARWATTFSHSRRTAFRARRLQNVVTTFNAGFLIVASLVVFLVSAEWLQLSTSAFLSFFAAFSLLLLATLQFTAVAITLLSILPMFENLQPILDAEREVGTEKADPGELSGQVTLSHVSFKYSEDGPLVLDDLSLTIRPGEFLAVVGPSGCGKSTLVRQLLGFESPTSGAVLYDGLDLASLDVAAVRRQCGVVLQNGSLLAGDILTNIVGSSTYTEEDAWDAAEAAGLSEDIRAMPMGMRTAISEGARTLSGGQRQRLMLARALVAKPRLVILDEATSALDNPTQARVAESTRQLRATRIVIAHRLSTVIFADRILVMDQGRIVQEGTYEQLQADASGLFAQLTRRQLV